ncbi:TIGR04222 domain-containing membrane protein [Streptomyces sp. NPDC059590]|uniref:TIGR04222 domain-containing membrane protein n=1 Tax=Streptomyces sp. NPDC059590 TaxID=3346877 RepID=UPI0036913AF3
MRTIFRRRESAAPLTLDIYDIAYLAGGPRRVARTALIQLRERGAIKFIFSRMRALRAVDPADHAVERAIIKKCHPAGAYAFSAVEKVRGGPEMKKIGRRLASYGLLSRSRKHLTPAGERELEAARQEGLLPAYVFDGLAAVEDERLRKAVWKATPYRDDLGASLVRMGEAIEDADEYDRELASASDAASASDSASDSGSGSDSGSDWGSHSYGGHASCGGGGGGGGGD